MLHIFKYIDNFIDIIVKDRDQQNMSVGVYDFKFMVRDRSENLIFNKDLTLIEGSSNKLALDIPAAETLELAPGLYTWALVAIDENNYKLPVFLELNNDAEAQLKIVDGPPELV